MNRTEFKKRMQSLKSYREQNPDKGYWDWRNSLPDNLKYTDDLEYDMKGAYESGAQPILGEDGFYHLPSRDPESGKILKSSTHPTYWKALTEDDKIGYKTYFVGRDTYTWNDEDSPFIPWQKAEQFEEGGEIPPDNSPVHVNPFTTRPLSNGSITSVFDLEDAVNLTPIGDILSIRDAYTAAKNRDLLGVGLAGLGFLPFMGRIKPIDRPPIPTVNRDAWQRKLDAAVEQQYRNKRTMDEFFDQRNQVYESMFENEDAFRRAAAADRNSNSNYITTYTQMLQDYNRSNAKLNPSLAQPIYDPDLYSTSIKAQVDPLDPNTIRLNTRYKDPDELDETFQNLNKGLVRHEMGHGVDVKAGLDYTDRLADPSKFEPTDRLKTMYPKSYKRIQDYLLNGSEIKSHMNEFREFLFQQGDHTTKETVKSIRQKLDKYKDQFKNLNILFDVYKNKRQFVKDYNNVPITATNQNQNLV